MIIVSALANNRMIGYQGKLPWHLPDELRWFRDLTMGHVCLMGRGTWDGGIPKPLFGRENWVVTSRPIEGVQPHKIFSSVDEARMAAQEVKNRKVFVIGGASLFTQCLPWVTDMYLTHVDLEPEGDTWFPEVDYKEWQAEILRTVDGPIAYKTVHYGGRSSVGSSARL